MLAIQGLLILSAVLGSEVATAEAPVGTSERVLIVEDLNCPVCPLNVRDALNALPGVRVQSIQPTEPRVRLLLAESAASEQRMLRAVRRAGHRAYFPLDEEASGR